MFPNALTELRMRLVRENACSSPCCRSGLSTQSVLSVVASNPVRNMFTTTSRSSLRDFICSDTSM